MKVRRPEIPDRRYPCIGGCFSSKRLFVLLIVAFLPGCSGPESAGVLSPPAKPKVAAPQLEDRASSQRSLIWTSGLELSAQDTQSVARQIKDVAVSRAGYVASFNARRGPNTLFYRITLRVPTDQREETLSEIKGLEVRVDHEKVESEDVTERRIDQAARLRNLRATERELRALLGESRQRSQQAEDIMAIYRELTEVRSRIEQAEGRLTALRNLIALATINIQLRPTESGRPFVGSGWHPLETVRNSVRALMFALRHLVDLVIVLVIVALPIAGILALVVHGWVRLWGYRQPRSNGLNREHE